MAKMMSSQHVPIKCLGDFSSTNERDRLCGCILIDKSKQVDTGVPDLINPQFFSTVPIHLPFIKENPPASSASTQYMFFHSPPPPPYQSIQWTPEEYTRDFQVGSYSIRSRNLCLLHPTAEGWRLSVFQNEKESLYCLSHVAGMNKIKLKKQNGKWIISKDTVSAADTLSLLKNQNRSDAEEAEHQTLLGNTDPNTQNTSAAIIPPDSLKTQNPSSVHK
ncbi:uncharacterized protein LOC130511581 [Raphanus sativus]|uniref:Uncharacterized protein LOC130511581 n=1 Tax=Raphanus sativus TaxID=3726 RepID=A0A9W3DLN2_RAPSA|nr:uncharacterized protein LOC130511581 [Raphanus sativus]